MRMKLNYKLYVSPFVGALGVYAYARVFGSYIRTTAPTFCAVAIAPGSEPPETRLRPKVYDGSRFTAQILTKHETMKYIKRVVHILSYTSLSL